MHLVLELPAEEEAEFEAWAAQQGEAVLQNAQALQGDFAAGRNGWGETLRALFLRAVSLTQPILTETYRQPLDPDQYLLLLLETITALYHAYGGRPLSLAEISARTPLEDAMTLYDYRVVSLGIAARIANVSQSEFIDALGQAGISVFQYGPEEVLADVAAVKAR
jgi:predicted HTH domain antitoxin